MSSESSQTIRSTTPEARDQPPEFSLSRRRMAGAGCVALSGELDLATAPVADHELRQAQREARDVLLDLRALTFIDVCGLNMILAAATRARQEGARMVVLHGSSPVSRIFELTEADRVLETTTDPSAADAPAEHNGARRGASTHGAPERFRWDIVDEDDRVRIAPVGELDVASTPQLEHAICALRQAGAAHLIIDLRRVTFIDSTGLRLALDLDAATRDNGLRLELLPGPPQVQRIFELTGTLDQLPFITPDPLDSRARDRLRATPGMRGIRGLARPVGALPY
jgi:anti-sigma B factor antagonist